MQELLANGNVLTVEPHARSGPGSDRTTRNRRLVWEYYNVAGWLDGEPHVGVITHAERFRPDDLPFLPDPVS